MSADEVKTATGIKGTGAPSKSGGADVCSWFGGAGAAIVPGVGEKAFFIDGKTGQMPTATMSAASGPNVISVQVMSQGMDAAARKKAATELAKVVLTKL